MRAFILTMAALLLATPAFAANPADAAAKQRERKIEELKKRLARAEQQRERVIQQNERQIKGKQDWLQRIDKSQKDNEAFAVKSDEKLRQAIARRDQLKRQFEDRATDKQLQNQDLAIRKQAALNDTIDILKKALEDDESKLEQLQQKEYKDNELVQKNAQAMKMVEAFELAKELEQEITESYKDLKATQTAIQKKMSFEAAEKITDVAKPERLEANAKDIELNPRTKEELDRQKQAQKEVVAEANEMVESSLAMMEEAMDIVMPQSGEDKVEKKGKEVRWLEEKDFESKELEEKIAQMEEEAVFELEMEKAAAEDDSQKAKDLAALMSTLKAMEEAKKEENAKDEEALKKALEEAKAAKEGGNNPPELKGGEKWLQPGNVAAVGGVPKDGKAIPAKWMYITSWHVIGPFPNPNRVNLRRKFAPESVVDLDATYAGANGKALRWSFVQARNVDFIDQWKNNHKNAAMVMPEKAEEYAIYYAYAEVFFDKDCDRWVAIGSDDRSDVWVNGFHVWGSSNKLKGWRLNEDYRRVHFKKGRNKILLRCENGHWNIGWSMCIALDDATDKL